MCLLHPLRAALQIFVHTELVPKLWWPIELIMNTPSHHRVHHARNYGMRCGCYPAAVAPPAMLDWLAQAARAS